MPMVLGLLGKMGAGKSTLANLLVSNEGDRWARVSVAGPLKELCCQLFNLDRDIVFNGTPEQKANTLHRGISYRKIMQDVGTFARSYDEACWVRMLEPAIHTYLNGGINVVIDDIRFPNEARLVASLGGKTVRVMRGDGDYVYPKFSTHTSETALDMYRPDLMVWNRGTPDELYRPVVAWLNTQEIN